MNINFQKQNSTLLMQVVLLVMIILLVGCGSIQVGRNFDIQAFENLAKTGETTKAQVLGKIGRPKSTGVSITTDGERLLEWNYFYATGKLSGMENAQLKILQIRFDQSGILRSYNWSNGDK